MLASVTRALGALPPSARRDAFLAFVADRGSAALLRTGGPDHLTGSCFVLGPHLDTVLLCLHRKGGFWVQFGGHVEPEDRSLADTARREAREESGITRLELLSDAVVDLDRHDLHGGFTCAAHWDVGFVAVVDPASALAVSDESDDVRWFPVDALPANVPIGLDARIAAARTAAAGILATRTAAPRTATAAASPTSQQ
jgi:8-oxo-dGTP pyrophosphatase MutT (NUDIX family)